MAYKLLILQLQRGIHEYAGQSDAEYDHIYGK